MYRAHTDARVLPALDALNAGRLDDAKSRARSLLEDSDLAVRVQAALVTAFALLRESDTRGAVDVLGTVIDADDKEALALHAVCILRLGIPETAHREFARAVELERGAHGYLPYDYVFLYVRECRNAHEWSAFWQWTAVLAQVYGGFRITDASFLGIRELPPFESLVEEVSQALDAGAPHPDPAPWCDLLAAIDAEGKACLAPVVARIGSRGGGRV